MSATSSLLRKVLYSFVASLRFAGRHSRLKIAVVLVFAIVLEGGLCFLFVDGFRVIEDQGQIAISVVSNLFYVFFLGLSFMLIVSSMITSYASMYQSKEVSFLVVRPYSISHITTYKFLESCLLSSWAFFFIIVPFVAAYAWHEKETLLFPVWTLVFSVPFVVLCSGIGTIMTMLVVRFVPRGRVLKISVFVFFLVALVLIGHTVHAARTADDPTVFALNRIIPGFRLASHPLMPGWWAADGILSCTGREWVRGAMLWSLLTTSALVVCVAVESVGRLIYYRGWQRVVGSGRTAAKRPLMGGLDRVFSFLPHDSRAMIIKDIRNFLRDPLQWSQFLIFFGLLTLYFLSLRSLKYHELAENWRNLIAFLNLFSIATVLCALACRFVYPQLSLEGQGFWVLGLSPTTMGRILMTKFFESLAAMAALSLSLMCVSLAMLRVEATVWVVAMPLAVAVAAGVSGMSTGLGAVFLDLKQRNPAAIVSGFGGTLNLIFSLGFMLATVIPFAFVFHLRFIGRLTAAQFDLALGLGMTWLVLITIIAAAVPLAIGLKSLLMREY